MENSIIEISDENIFLEFNYKDQMYVVISNSTNLDEDDEVCIAKIDFIDEQRIIRNIESDEEYEEVEKEYERILGEYLEDEEND